MISEENVIKKKVVINNDLGMHVRPASLFAQTAGKFSSIVMVRKKNQLVDGKSIMQLLMLGALQGTELVLEAEGDDAEEALSALEEIIADNFGE